MSSDSKRDLKELLKKLKHDIIPMFDKAISDSNVIFPNPGLLKCWKVMNCTSTECELHGNDFDDGVRCWQIAGTYCGGEPQGSFVQKFGDCSKCEVFKASCPTIIEEIGEHFNNMVFLLKKRNRETLEDRQRIEQLNRELILSLEQISSKNTELKEIKITDRLTGLFDRHHLVDVLNDEISRCNRYGHSLTLMLIEVDDFKSFNENYGNNAGDRMLAFAGSLIKKNIRKFDKAFRYSAKEFAVVLPETDLTLAFIVAERIRTSFKNKTFTVQKKGTVSKKRVSRTLSIGITSGFNYKTNSTETEELINQASRNIFQAKEKGGNICVRFE
jgi:diguanylate cyclase (GGDEF)-like protein